MSRGKWTLLQWCTQRFRFLLRQPDTPSPPLSTRQRIPAIDKISKSHSDTRPIKFLDLVQKSPSQAITQLNSWLDDIDVDTSEEYVSVLLHRIPNHREMHVHMKPIVKKLADYDLDKRVLSLDKPISEEKTNDILFKFQAEKFLPEVFKSEHNDYDSILNVPQEVMESQKAWLSQLTTHTARDILHDSALTVLNDVLTWEEQCVIVCGFLCEFVTKNVHSKFPQSLAGLCLKLGKFLERKMLAKTALKNDIHMFHPHSRFIWGLLAASPWNVKQHIVLGSVWIESAVAVCKSQLIQSKETVWRPSFWKTWYVNKTQRRGVLVVNNFLLKQLEEQLGSSCKAPYLTSEYLPLLHKPRPWTSFSDHNSLAPKSGMTLVASPSTEGIAAVRESLENGNALAHIKGLNRSQSQQWCVNASMSDIIKRSSATERSRQDDHDEQMKIAVTIAETLVGRPFYIPMYLDFRGRCYTAAKILLTFMGNDSIRALFNFADTKPLGDHGLKWSKLHLVNLVGHCKSLSFEKRLEWIESYRDHIIKSANDPLNYRWWQTTSEKPFQTLAACIELTKAWKSDNPAEFHSSLPIQLDGTSNGLQHSVALARDHKNAPFVNLQTTPDKQCGDIYTTVATTLSAGTANKISRKDIKQPVMTYFYGASEKSISDLLIKKDGSAGSNLTTKPDFVRLFRSTMNEMFSQEIEIQNWLVDCAKRIMNSRVASQTFPGAALTWTSPLGLPVVQPYVNTQYMAIRTSLQSFWLPSPYHSQPVDRRKQVASVNANFVHSSDAAHMLLTALLMPESCSFAAIHDSFWTHAGSVDKMNCILRDAFVKIHTRNLLEDLRQEWSVRYGHYMVLASVYSDAPMYDQLIWQRSGISGGERQKVLLEQELVDHYKNSSNVSYQKKFAHQMKWRDSKPYMGTPGLPSVKVWTPLQLDPPPKKGTFDSNEVRNASYFFS